MPVTSEDDDDHHHHDYTSGVMPGSRCRHNYNERTEAGMNRQINLFMHVGYVYHSMVGPTGCTAGGQGVGGQGGVAWVYLLEEWFS